MWERGGGEGRPSWPVRSRLAYLQNSFGLRLYFEPHISLWAHFIFRNISIEIRNIFVVSGKQPRPYSTPRAYVTRRWAEPVCDGTIGQPLSRWAGAGRGPQAEARLYGTRVSLSLFVSGVKTKHFRH